MTQESAAMTPSRQGGFEPPPPSKEVPFGAPGDLAAVFRIQEIV